jgi:hypothetical protein
MRASIRIDELALTKDGVGKFYKGEWRTPVLFSPTSKSGWDVIFRPTTDGAVIKPMESFDVDVSFSNSQGEALASDSKDFWIWSGRVVGTGRFY